MQPGLGSSLFWGVLAFTFYGVAMVMMKYGADALSTPKAVLTDAGVRVKALVWATGSGLNLAFTGTLGLAVGLGHASVVSALNGYGLVVVAVLGRVFLKERLVRLQLLGMVVVVAGVAGIGFSASPMAEGPLTWTMADLLWFCAGLAVLSGAGVAGSYAQKWRHAAPVFAAVAGVLGGVAIVLQKVAITPVLEVESEQWVVWRLATSLLFWAWSATATGSFVVLQVAYKFGKANTIAPVMVATMIVVPLLGGPLVLGEVLTAGQMAGTLVVIAGAVMITLFEPAPTEQT